MMNRWLKGVAVAALTAVGTMAAQAADLPTRKEAPAPIFVPPPFTWTGFYVGVNAGGIWPSGGRNASIFDPNAGIDGGFINAGFPGGLGSQSAGFIGGGQAGYNWQTGAFVLGVETDFDGSTLSKSFNNVGGAVIPILLSFYLHMRYDLWAAGAVATAIVAFVVHRMATPVPGVGISVPTFAPPLLAAGAALVLSRRFAAPIAYIGGSLGVLIGADLTNLGRLRSLGAPVASIGGAGTFDGIFLTGVIAVLLASLVVKQT